MGFLLPIIQKHFFRVLMYGVIIIGAWLLLYSAFLKPTKDDRTTNNADKIENNTYGKDVTINVGLGGCAHFRAEKPLRPAIK